MAHHEAGIEGVTHGPFLPLTEREISIREHYDYRRTLTGEERLVLQGLHQISEIAWSNTNSGDMMLPNRFMSWHGTSTTSC